MQNKPIWSTYLLWYEWKIECWLCTYFEECRNLYIQNALISWNAFSQSSKFPRNFCSTLGYIWNFDRSCLIELCISVYYLAGLWYCCWTKIFCHLYYPGSLFISWCQANFNTRLAQKPQWRVRSSLDTDHGKFRRISALLTSLSICGRVDLIQCTVIVWESRAGRWVIHILCTSKEEGGSEG